MHHDSDDNGNHLTEIKQPRGPVPRVTKSGCVSKTRSH